MGTRPVSVLAIVSNCRYRDIVSKQIYFFLGDYHQVHSDGPFNLAASILFRRFDHSKPESFDDCTNTTGIFII